MMTKQLLQPIRNSVGTVLTSIDLQKELLQKDDIGISPSFLGPLVVYHCQIYMLLLRLASKKNGPRIVLFP